PYLQLTRAFLVSYTLLSFFFSSRRRHTRSKRDWSSDVCSSDLTCWCAPGRSRAAWGSPRIPRRCSTERSCRCCGEVPLTTCGPRRPGVLDRPRLLLDFPSPPA